MDVQHSGITQKIGGSLGAVPWLLPSETASEILSWEGFWEETISWIWLDISLLRNSLYLYGMFLRSFLRRKHILDIVSQKQISCDLSTSSAVAKWRGPLGSSSWKLLELTSVSRFLAYVTRPHEWRISVLAEKNLLWGKKMIQCTHECHENDHEYFKRKCCLGGR